ncbi:hypothetical protein ZYGR_0Z00450 [Zygosaccharomyces rouxii]|uniref:Ubiquitin carboxyl-terminal hydrolase n=2 Tax=Zygosaccharomyces rouxii TaxID=4956 RepID=C5E1T1_ZYGRC|nr:uncharacterized protein ZYRO0G01188g [Zygosaccharomyces rouxii]KAH9202122.1 hypothetical protein LQ764DRAFT_191304 [Zygosaccharomyces rouxii]GAV50622.1 hypothetical protein ZYGR_0Z00450 [Zygosaccharomyces rouxii]CAR29124.1 ZYRO0G01188p [Zygosaccharomyces rouxii]
MSDSKLEFNIKHAGKSYPISLGNNATAGELKSCVEDLTKVPLSRQKYMVKGGLVDDSAKLVDVIKPGSTLMLLGTADAGLVSKPAEKNQFIEDLAPEEQLQRSSDLPIGFQNMGNTCYLNSTLQALYRIKPLRELILSYNGSETATSSAADSTVESHKKIVLELQRCFQNLKNKSFKSVMPMVLLTALRKCYPQFAERDSQMGFYKQQDAEELFTQLFHSLSVVFGDKFEDEFSINFKTTTTDSANENDVSVKEESDTKLQCHISSNTNFLKNGLVESLHETIEKRSEFTGANSKYVVDKQITRLPKYLTVQYVRFFWKRSTGKKSKILRKVSFPFQLDVSDMLTPEYMKEKIKVRDEFRRIEKEKAEKDRDSKRRKIDSSNGSNLSSMTPRERYETEQALAQSEREHWEAEFKKHTPSEVTEGENPSSLYELVGVITHQGANSESGHYQSFIRDDYDEDKWYKFNDDKVSVVDKEKIESLSGGGESDSALILIYKGFGL